MCRSRSCSANSCLEVGYEGDLSARTRWPRGARLRGGAATPSRGRRGARAGPRRRRHPHGTLLGSDLDHTGRRAAPVAGRSRSRILRRDLRPGGRGQGRGRGDLVYGLNDWYRDGASAEYCVARVADFAHKPSRVDHVHAAATPISALTAWQGLVERAGLAAGQRVLIHGAAGGVGTFAVQLARWRGARVTGTASAANLDFVRSLGADEVIDYRAERFEDMARDVDVVFDTVGGETLERSWGVLKPGGRLVTIAASGEQTTDERVRAAYFIVA